MATFAFTTSALFSFWCDSIKFVAQDEDNDLISDLHFGPWYQKETRYVTDNTISSPRDVVEQERVCVEWSADSNVDAAWKLVRVFSVIVPLVGGLLAIPLWFRPCLAGRLSSKAWRMIALVNVILLAPLQGLLFLLFQSNACQENLVIATIEEAFARDDLYETDCSWDQGSTANVFSVFLWFAAGVLLLVMGAPQRPEQPPVETQAVTYEQTVNPDGTTSVKEVSVVKGTAVSTPEWK